MFRANLASNLRTTLGLEVELATDKQGHAQSWFQVCGVSRSLCDAWSSRRKQIEQATDPEWGSLPQARANANTATRQSKRLLPNVDILQTQWTAQAAAHGFGLEQAQQLLGQARQRTEQVDNKAAIKEATRELIKQEAHFPYRDLLRRVTEKLQHTGLNAREIAQGLDETLADSDHYVTLKGEGVHRQITTKEMLKVEREFLDRVDTLLGHKGARVSNRIVASVLADRPTLGKDQADAVRKLTQDNHAIRVLQGVAGAGKSFTLNAVREAFSKANYHVIGGALSAVAKEELEGQSKIASRTVASYLYQIDREANKSLVSRLIQDLKELCRGRIPRRDANSAPFNNKTVLVLDEAGMLDTRSLNKLLKYVIKAKATIVLVGDDKQLQPIEAGGPFQYLLRKLNPAELTENRRQQNAQDRRAVELLRKGKAHEAIKNYHERGQLTVEKTRRDCLGSIVNAWKQAGGTSTPKQHAVFVETRAEAAEVNRRCQKAMVATNKPSTYLEKDGARFYDGDRVLFHKADRARGIENGYRGTVIHIDEKRQVIHVRLDHHKQDAPEVVQIPKQLLVQDRVTLGYASTTHKMQGQTVEHSYVLLGGSMTHLNMAYTQLTRGKYSTKLFVDKHAAGDEFKTLSSRLSIARTKTLAHEQLQEHDRSQTQSL